MKFRYITLTICILLSALATRAQTDSFIVDGVYRNYIYHLPTGYNAANAYPLVLNLHGYTSNASQQMLYTQMNTSADANGYIVVYPNGIANYWNSFGAGADDVKFLSQLIDTISAHQHVNPKRVYSCGMSNGGYMSYTLACTLADKLAAIASVAGTMSLNTYSTCQPARKIPVMHIHGTTDPTVNYNTGAPNSIGVEQTLAFWRDTLDCQHITDTTDIPNTSTADGCTAQRIHYPTCAGGNDILFFKITGGGHTWPSALIDIPSYGNTNHDMSATTEIWNFFNRYTLDGPVATGINDVQGAATTIYPNPAANTLTISSDYEVQNTTICDAAGRTVIAVAKNKTIDISSLGTGIYIAKISCTNDQQQVIKFVKQ